MRYIFMRKHAISFHDCPRLTEQHHKDKCDIRRIVKSAMRTGIVDHPGRSGQFADMLGIPDFKESMDRIAAAKSTFASLPAKLRLHFQNDPVRFVSYVLDKNTSNADLVKLGLANVVPPKTEPKPEAKPDA